MYKVTYNKTMEEPSNC